MGDLNLKPEAHSHCDFFRQGGKKKIDRLYTKSDPKEKPTFDKIISSEIFSTEFKPVNVWNFEFEYQQNMEIKRTFLHFWPIKSPSQGTKYEIVQH